MRKRRRSVVRKSCVNPAHAQTHKMRTYRNYAQHWQEALCTTHEHISQKNCAKNNDKSKKRRRRYYKKVGDLNARWFWLFLLLPPPATEAGCKGKGRDRGTERRPRHSLRPPALPSAAKKGEGRIDNFDTEYEGNFIASQTADAF